MVNLKTKFDKHANDNEKRRRSIKEKEKAKSNQSQIIKQALSNSTLSNNSSKKIIFTDDDDDDSNHEIVTSNSNGENSNKNGKTVLFDSSDSETEDFELKEKSQFSGEKGFELLNLQSTYGNDDRFKIDARFFENEEEEQDIIEDNNKELDQEDTAQEKIKQLKILESVLGTPVISHEKEKKVKKRTKEMVRYDASNKDHEIYEINTQPETIKSASKKRKEVKKTSKTEKEEVPTPKVSKEKFYEVSSEIKNRFKEKEEGGQFSLLQTYGSNNIEENEEVEQDSEDELLESMGEDDENYKLDADHKIEDKEIISEPMVGERSVLAKGIWKESFFFVPDDPRFKEGLEFINKKNSEEAKEAAENYDKTRKRLKEILRLHLKKQMHKKDPFRNKVGGMNKKQLAGSRLKNTRMAFNKRKPPAKKNPGGRI